MKSRYGVSYAHDPRDRGDPVRSEEARSGRDARPHAKARSTPSLLTENPLPDKFRVQGPRSRATCRPSPANDRAASAGVANVDYGADIVTRCCSCGDVLRRVGIGVIAVFFLIVAAIIIANTIRLTVFARRREIAIMQLVGATNMYIRMPFICEGLIAGVLGALLAVAILTIARYTLWPKLLLALPFVQFCSTTIETPRLVAELLVPGARSASSLRGFRSAGTCGRNFQ